jgi:hypothetical protein
MEGERRDRLDSLLDEALATYANPEPRAGLESRVLAQVRAGAARPRFPRLRWALPVAALACLLAAVTLWNHRTAPPAAPAIRSIATSSPPSAAATASRPKPVRVKAKRPRRARLPRQPEFPIRIALTREERAWMALARRAPEDALQAVGEPPTRIEPLRIQEIQLQPLPVGDGVR